MRAADSSSIVRQLERFLLLAGVTSRRWLVSVVLGSVCLAVLDTIGMAAVIPLMQVLTGGTGGSGPVVDRIGDLVGSHDPTTLVPVIAGIVAVAFIGKSVATIAFRWWLLGRTTRVSADAATSLLRQ